MNEALKELPLLAAKVYPILTVTDASLPWARSNK